VPHVSLQESPQVSRSDDMDISYGVHPLLTSSSEHTRQSLAGNTHTAKAAVVLDNKKWTRLTALNIQRRTLSPSACCSEFMLMCNHTDTRGVGHACVVVLALLTQPLIH
jgi:hypothetical protein